MGSLAERLSHLRSLVDVSASRLGIISGLSRATVALLESGARLPGTETIRAVAATLGVTTDYLLNGTGPEPLADDVRAAVARAELAFADQGAA